MTDSVNLMDLRTNSRTTGLNETEKIKFNIDGIIASHNSGNDVKILHSHRAIWIRRSLLWFLQLLLFIVNYTLFLHFFPYYNNIYCIKLTNWACRYFLSAVTECTLLVCVICLLLAHRLSRSLFSSALNNLIFSFLAFSLAIFSLLRNRKNQFTTSLKNRCNDGIIPQQHYAHPDADSNRASNAASSYQFFIKSLKPFLAIPNGSC